MPSDVPGIAFLSGGQSEIESTRNLNEINKINDTNFLITFHTEEVYKLVL